VHHDGVGGDRGEQLAALSGLVWARAEQHQRAERLDAPAQVVDQAQRLGVGPLRVVDADQQRVSGGQPGQGLESFLEGLERGFADRRAGCPTSDPAGAEELVRDPEGVVALEHGASSHEDLETLGQGTPAGSLDQGAFSDPRCSLDHGRRSGSLPGQGQKRLEARQLVLAFEEDHGRATHIAPA